MTRDKDTEVKRDIDIKIKTEIQRYRDKDTEVKRDIDIKIKTEIQR